MWPLFPFLSHCGKWREYSRHLPQHKTALTIWFPRFFVRAEKSRSVLNLSFCSTTCTCESVRHLIYPRMSTFSVRLLVAAAHKVAFQSFCGNVRLERRWGMALIFDITLMLYALVRLLHLQGYQRVFTVSQSGNISFLVSSCAVEQFLLKRHHFMWSWYCRLVVDGQVGGCCRRTSTLG